jgi:hypothetical protein
MKSISEYIETSNNIQLTKFSRLSSKFSSTFKRRWIRSTGFEERRRLSLAFRKRNLPQRFLPETREDRHVSSIYF